MAMALQLQSSCCKYIVRFYTAVITERRISTSSLSTPPINHHAGMHVYIIHVYIFLICYQTNNRRIQVVMGLVQFIAKPPSNHWGKPKYTPPTSELNGEWIKMCCTYHSQVLAEYTPMYMVCIKPKVSGISQR